MNKLTKMEEYIRNLKKEAKLSPSEAKEKALKALKETGVVNDDGTPKDKIVSWD